MIWPTAFPQLLCSVSTWTELLVYIPQRIIFPYPSLLNLVLVHVVVGGMSVIFSDSFTATLSRSSSQDFRCLQQSRRLCVCTLTVSHPSWISISKLVLYMHENTIDTHRPVFSLIEVLNKHFELIPDDRRIVRCIMSARYAAENYKRAGISGRCCSWWRSEKIVSRGTETCIWDQFLINMSFRVPLSWAGLVQENQVLCCQSNDLRDGLLEQFLGISS